MGENNILKKMDLHQTPGPVIGWLLCLYRGDPDIPETTVRNVFSKMASHRKMNQSDNIIKNEKKRLTSLTRSSGQACAEFIYSKNKRY